jgi:hypothetical protein
MQPALKHTLFAKHKIQAVSVFITISVRASYAIWESVSEQQLTQLANTIPTVLKGCIASMIGNTKGVSI